MIRGWLSEEDLALRDCHPHPDAQRASAPAAKPARACAAPSSMVRTW
jgi:hypothetical protein